MKKSMFTMLKEERVFPVLKFKKVSLLLSVLVLGFLQFSYAQTITSTTTGGNWNAPGTWVGNVVPTSANDVVIDGAVTVNADGLACKNLTINSSKSLSFNGGSTNPFTVNGNVTINGTLTHPNNSSRPVDVYGDFIINGTYAPTDQTDTRVAIRMRKAATKIGGTATTKEFANLEINTPNVTDVVTAETNFFLGVNNSNAVPILTLTRGAFKLTGITMTVRKYGTITATANGNLANSGNGNADSDGGTVLLAASSGPTLSFSGGLVLYNFTSSGGGGDGNLTLTLAGSTKINGTFIRTTNSTKIQGTSPLWGSSSNISLTGTFTYTPGGTDTKEWAPSNSGTIGTTAGYPNSVIWLNGTGTLALSGATKINGTLQASNGTNTVAFTLPAQNITCAAVDIKANGTLTAVASNTISCSGNWANAGTFNRSTGTVVLNGGAAQTISGTNVTTFNNLTVNNTSGGITLSKAATVAGTLTLTSGIVTTDATNLLTLSATTVASLSGGSNSSYINGPFSRGVIATGTFLFPVGKGTTSSGYLPFSIINPDGATLMTVTPNNTDAGSSATFNSPITGISHSEFWLVNVNTGVLNANAGKVILGRESALGSLNLVAKSTAQAGAYSSLGGATPVGNTITSVSNTGAGATSYYVLATNAVPTVTTTGTLSAFGSVVAGSSSTQQSYQVSGSNLTANIVVTAPAGFGVSTTNGSGYGSSVSLAPSSGTVANTTIYVVYSPSAATGATGSQNITNASTGATTQNVVVSGNALATQPSSNGSINFTSTGTNSIQVNLPSIGNGSNRIIVIRQGSAVSFAPADGVAPAGVSNNYLTATDQGSGNKIIYDGSGNGTNVVTVTNLNNNQTYHFAVYEYNIGTGTSHNYYLTSPAINSQALVGPEVQTSGTLSAFGNIVTGGISSSQSYTVSGTNLTSDITVTAPSNFLVSTTNGSGYAASLNLTPVSGTVSSTTIYVVFSPSAANGANSGNITNTATSATTQNIAVSGNAIAAEPVGAGTITFGTQSGTSLPLNITAGGGTNRIIVIRQGSAVSFTPADAAAISGTVSSDFSAATDQGSGNKIVYNGTGSGNSLVTVTNLTKGQTYYFAVYEYNVGTGTSQNYLTTGVAASNYLMLNPTITVGSVTAFSNQVTGTNSVSKSYSVSGSQLLSNITITAPTGFGVSTDNNTFSSSVSLTAVANTVSSTTVYVRFSPSSANGANSGNVSHTATDATTQNVAVSGNAIAVEPTTNGTITFGTVTGSSIIVNLPATGNGGRRIIVARAGSAVSFTPSDAVAPSGVNAVFTSATDQGSGNRIVYDGTGSGSSVVTVSGLSSLITYHFAVYEYNVGTSTSQNYLTTGFAIANTSTSFSVGSACTTGGTGASGSPAIIPDCDNAAPTIDGTEDAVWAKAPTYTVNRKIDGTGNIQGSGSTFKALFDNTNFYLLVKVTDANLRSGNCGQGTAWQYDAVEVYVGVDGNTTHQSRFNYGCATNTSTNITGGGQWTSGVVWAIPSVSGGYNLELKIPWATMGITPANGTTIRFDLNIDDNQTASSADRTVQYAWSPTATSSEWSTPSQYGYAQLSVCTPPVLANPTVTNVTATSALLGATVTSVNGGTLTSGGAGTVYRTTTGVTTENALAGVTPVLNTAFTQSRTDLSPQTQYYFKGFASRTNFTVTTTGISSTEGNFWTLSRVADAQVSNLSGSYNGGTGQIDLTWTAATSPALGGADVLEYIILRREDGNNATATNIVNATAPASLSLPSGTSYRGRTTSTSFSDGSLVNGNTYNYVVLVFTRNTASTVATYNYLTTITDGVNATAVSTCGSNTWIGGNGNWNNASNWSCGMLPQNTTTIVVSSGNPQLDVDFAVGGSLTLSGSASLTVLPNITLSVDPGGTLDFGGRPVTVKSTDEGTGAIGQILGTLQGESNVTVERYIPDNGKRSWRLLSVPTHTSGQTIRQAWMEGDVNAANQNNLPGYGTIISAVASQVANGFDAVSPSTSIRSYTGSAFMSLLSVNVPIATTSGYFLYIRGDRSLGVNATASSTTSTILRSTGTLYKGIQTSIGVPANTFGLIGNVFASEIDFQNISKSNIVNTLYIWDSKMGATGGYETFPGIDGFEASTGGGSWEPGDVNSKIQSGQAFFVAATSAIGGGTVTLTESSKSAANSTRGLRPAAPAVISKLKTRLLAGDRAYDGNVVVFDNKYSNAIDGNDAVKLDNPGENFAIASEGKVLSAEGRQSLSSNADEASLIAYSMKNMQQRDYSLEFTATNLGSGEAYLEDKFLGTKTPVSLTGVTKVSFSVTADPQSAAAGRFQLVLRPAAAPAVDNRIASISVYPNPVETGTMNVQFVKQAKGKYNLKLVDLAGRVVYSSVREHAGGSAAQSVQLPSAIGRGSYQLVITNPDKTKQVQQLFINK
ncbi:MAG: sugar-binding protein [Ferruginibacter sp.]